MGLWTRLRLRRQPDGTSIWWGIAILLAGMALVASMWHGEGPWKDFSFEIGGAAAVGGIVLLFKPWLMRKVDERAQEAAATTAKDVATSRTEALEEPPSRRVSTPTSRSREHRQRCRGFDILCQHRRIVE